eukprot:1438330-Pyramimonas_sp.AAC.1
MKSGMGDERGGAVGETGNCKLQSTVYSFTQDPRPNTMLTMVLLAAAYVWVFRQDGSDDEESPNSSLPCPPSYPPLLLLLLLLALPRSTLLLLLALLLALFLSP